MGALAQSDSGTNRQAAVWLPLSLLNSLLNQTRVQPLVTSPDNLSLVPRNHMGEGGNRGLHTVL